MFQSTGISLVGVNHSFIILHSFGCPLVALKQDCGVSMGCSDEHFHVTSSMAETSSRHAMIAYDCG